MLRTQAMALSAVICVFAFAASASAGKPETGFLNRTLTAGAKAAPFQVYVPANWTKKKKWPVILFLHGAGERGDDGLVQTEVGIGTAIRRYVSRVPFIVVLPQCLKNRWWTEPEMQAVALKALDQSIAEFNGDPERLYLTGLSMGGYGTWAIASSHPGRFAAFAVICGGVRPPPGSAPRSPETPDLASVADPYTPIAQKVGKTPVWVFHGGADPVVPVTESRKMVEALKAAGGNVKYNEYEGVRHDSWVKAYAEPDFFEWLLSCRLEKSAKNTGQARTR
ncbi:MAG TPA: prolyl oligopeptidase family serine peptidase [Blastocatellia bacterium]|nr:prolyl oligopeptidase family serine peptidase [Blastocatellia bacterium]